MQCSANSLLKPGAAESLVTSLDEYPVGYDEVFLAVGRNLAKNGTGGKVDLAALVFWKHIQNSPWMKTFLVCPETDVRKATAAALAPGLTDGERITALASLPGFRRGGPVTSTLFAAWNPRKYGVWDKRVKDAREGFVGSQCSCDWRDLPTYWEHLRRLARELSAKGNRRWTPRMVDQAMFKV